MTLEELESKPLEQLNLQKYQQKEQEDYEGQQHLLEPVSSLNMGYKQPQKSKYNDAELLEPPQANNVKVSNKLQLPKI